MTMVDSVLKLLEGGRQMTARQLADSLGVDRREINSLLYGELRGRVEQASNYRWQIAGIRRPKTHTSPRIQTLLSNLCDYYLECLSLDEDQGVSTFAESRYDEDYLELPRLQLDDDDPAVMADDQVRQFIGRSRRARFPKQIFLGYPVRLRHFVGRRGCEGFFVDPVFLYQIDDDALEAGYVASAPDAYPRINPRVVESFMEGARAGVLGEVAQLSEELAIGSGDSGVPSVDDMVLRLRSVRADWDWVDEVDPEDLNTSVNIRDLHVQGIHNKAVLIAIDRAPYTIGLENELRSLKNIPAETYAGTALGALLNAEGRQDAPDDNSSDQPLIELLPLNVEQRAAVESALTNPVTVVTGPPGTGKSQVVSSILTNAAWRGQRVLFASKNNKAVDVVDIRVNSLGPRPVLYRTGANTYQHRLAEYIDALLSATTSDSDASRYRSAMEQYRRLDSRDSELDEEAKAIVHARNLADESDRKLDTIRATRSPEFFGAIKDIDEDSIVALSEAVLEALDRCEASNNPLLSRLVWPLVRGSRFAVAKDVISNSKSAFDLLEIRAPESDITPDTLVSWQKWLVKIRLAVDDVATIKIFRAEFVDLKNLRPLEDVAKDKSRLTKTKADSSRDVWNAWLRMQPGNLTPEDRRNLGNYVSALRLVLAARDAGDRPSRELVGQLNRLAPRVTSILTCWAVTALAVRGRIPLEPNFFDIVVFDEASQCDIASAIPLLYRAKRAVVIGDPMQLTHISGISGAQDRQLISNHELTEHTRLAYSTNSLYSLGQSATRFVVSLRDHHRSHADIIQFSNTHFYGGDLRIATRYDRLKLPSRDQPAVRWVSVEGRSRRPRGGSWVNDQEAERVVSELRSLAVDRGYEGTIGVVTPFRSQAELIRDLVSKDSQLLTALTSAEFESDTVDKFQGDERDVMFFSPVVAPGIGDGATRFLNNQRNRFNVAVTRARAALVIVGDRAFAQNGDVKYMRDLSSYVDSLGRDSPIPDERPSYEGPEYPKNINQEKVSEWEHFLYAALYRQGIRTVPQWPVEQYHLDLALFDDERGRRLDIEVDGEMFHREWDGELRRRDQIRNQRMFELDWDVMRFWVYEVRDELDECVRRVEDWLRSVPSNDDPSS